MKSLSRQKRIFEAWWLPAGGRGPDLSKVHTKTLLRLLNETRKFGNAELDRKSHVLVEADQLKAELAKREHVLHQPDTKRIRQERARHRDRWRKTTGSRRPGSIHRHAIRRFP